MYFLKELFFGIEKVLVVLIMLNQVSVDVRIEWKKITCSHESHAPVDAFSETVTQQSFGDVSLVEKNRTNEIGVVDRFQDNFHFTLQQARFNEISCLIGIINRNTVVWFTFRIQFESWTLYKNTHL